MKARLFDCSPFIVLVISVGAAGADAQVSASLDTVRVTVTRDTARSPLSLPFALTIAFPDSTRPGQIRSSLDENLLLVPGVFSASRQNPSQDPRISIRGFGARSAFGVRGVRVLWDGIPLTVADGQTPVDYLDLDAIERVEVIRGTASSLYGNSSGGIISLSSRPDSSLPRIRLRHWMESGGLQRSGLSGKSVVAGVKLAANVTRTSGQGFRDYSRQQATRVSAKMNAQIGAQKVQLNFAELDMPLAQNPGALTAAQMHANPRQADPLSVRKAASKQVNQKQLGLTTSRAVRRGEISALVYGGSRDLANPLTFATVNLNRSSGGAGSHFSFPLGFAGTTVLLTGGLDAQIQNDDRHELENCVDTIAVPVSTKCPVSGKPIGTIRKNQRELVTSLGPFFKLEFTPTKRASLTIGARHDVLKFRVRDRLPIPQAQIQSGTRTMSATSPMVGVLFRLSPITTVYSSFSTAFETPTMTELANKPDGNTGLNPSLQPQVAYTGEFGLKGFLISGIQYDLAGYFTRVRDELIPFEIAGGGGRRYYRNAGRTRRTGIETSLSGNFHSADWAVAYTGSNFSFTNYTVVGLSYSGRRVPGIPRAKLDGSLTLRAGRAFLTSDGTLSSSTFVDDLNTNHAAGYGLANIRAGNIIPFGRFDLKPVIGIFNLGDVRYSASVNINAAGGKYYEPGSERLLYGMVQIENRF